jgi:hypothetical protein
VEWFSSSHTVPKDLPNRDSGPRTAHRPLHRRKPFHYIRSRRTGRRTMHPTAKRRHLHQRLKGQRAASTLSDPVHRKRTDAASFLGEGRHQGQLSGPHGAMPCDGLWCGRCEVTAGWVTHARHGCWLAHAAHCMCCTRGRAANDARSSRMPPAFCVHAGGGEVGDTRGKSKQTFSLSLSLR